MSEQKKYILNKEEAGRKIQRMAYEIAERNMTETPQALILAGIRDNGVVIARSLQHLLQQIYPAPVQVLEVELDKRHPGVITWSDAGDFNGKTIVLVDDVANSGKTMLYALKPLLEFHPESIQTLALVERTHKKFPVHTDYVGLSLSTTLQEHILVEVEGDRVTGAYLV